MEIFWFIVLGVLLTLFIVLDGFDFGTGIIYHFIAKTNDERRTVLNAIGPIWDGNEVWLIIAGGALFFAFPTAYASIFSGYYLALILLLWMLMFRGLSMELRSQISNPLWHSFWDAMLTIGSVALALLLGVALGNILRGVPLDADGFFFLPFWTNFKTGVYPGILDWFTVLIGVFSVVILAVHGANFIALKTVGIIQVRARKIARKGIWIVILFALFIPIASYMVQPILLENYKLYWGGIVLLVLSFLSLLGLIITRYKDNDLYAFVSSAFFIVLLMLNVAFSVFPNMMIATTNPSYNLTIYNTATSEYALRTGLVWYSVGAFFALCYTLFMYRSFKGKVSLPKEGEGY